MKHVIILLIALLFTGCQHRHAVIASTATVIGMELSQNPSSQMYQAKLGYNRAELAIVPSNRSARDGEVSVGGGAKDTANVLMELRYGNIFSLNSAGIYQRLAVGEVAVTGDSATVVFAKDPDGKINPETARAIAAVKAIPSPDVTITAIKAGLARSYMKHKDKQAAFDVAAQKEGFQTFQAMLADPAPDMQKLGRIEFALEKQGLHP